MRSYLVIYQSGDGRRSASRIIGCNDIDRAARDGIDRIESFFGPSASWFLTGVVDVDCAATAFPELEKRMGELV